MTDEERQRQMDFIVETLARVSVRLEQTELERKADAVRISRLEETLVTYSELSQRIYERLDDAFVNIAQLSDNISRQSERIAQQSDNIAHQSERISRLSAGMYQLSERVAERLENHESRIVNVEEAIVILTKLLNRGDNGASGS
jgi:ABC-type transporter Mla subunit MlaD